MERRRETRVTDSSASFVFDSLAKDEACPLLNLSRLGLGVKIPPASLALRTALEAIPLGDELPGTLRIRSESIPVHVALRVRNSAFAGLEYLHQHPTIAARIEELLTPKYVAASITELEAPLLGPDMDAAFVGDDFECLAIKPGVMAGSEVYQVFAFGRVVEFAGGKARFVPAPLVRTPSQANRGMSFVSEFETFTDLGGVREMRAFLKRFAEVVDEWRDCPADLAMTVSKLTKRNET